METLTKAEERIMQILWDIEKGFVKDILEQFPDPKPPYNSVSTIVRVLVKKNIVGYNSYGNTHQYYPLISKEEYSQEFLGRFVNNYFEGSFKKLVHFFSQSDKVDTDDVSEIMDMLKDIQNQKEEQ